MARKKRIIHPDYCYHVMLRGVGGRNIFNDDFDRARFCLLLQYASETCKFSIHGFCLMNNHVHLLLQPHTEDLASGMHRLAFRYAQYFNKKVDRQGYLYQGRYNAIPVQHGTYLQRLIRYIHRNPLRANLVKNLSDYPWSSYQAYIGKSEFSWLKTNLVLSTFNSDSHIALDLFQKYAHSNDTEAKIELEEIRNSTGIGAYGNELFVKEFQKVSDAESNVSKFCQRQENPYWFSGQQTKISLNMIIEATFRATKISLEEMQSSSKNMPLVDARAILVWVVLKLGLGKTSDLVNLLQRDPTSIARLTERANHSPRLIQIAKQILSELKLESY